MRPNEMPYSLTRLDLDFTQCANPDCDHSADERVLVLSPGCHPGSSVEASYDKDSGDLTLRCAGCDRFVCSVRVAPAIVENQA